MDISRSAAWPPAKSATRQAMAWVAKIQPICAPGNAARLPRYRASSGSHDPQMTYSRNIIDGEPDRGGSGHGSSSVQWR